MSSKDSKLWILGIIILLILGLIITSCLIIFKSLNKDNSPYKNVKIEDESLVINYPLFGNKLIDENISSYVRNVDKSLCDEVKYLVNIVDKYYNVVFTKYKDKKVVDYDSFIYDENGLVDFKEIISDESILNDIIKAYLFQNNIIIDNIDNAEYDYILNEHELEIIISNNVNNIKNFTIIKINYNELTNILKLRFEVDNSYVKVLTTTTTTIATTTTNISTTSKVNTTKKVTTTTDNGNKVIAFTFDDGPSKYTTEIMDTLDKYGAKATFFEVGYMIKSRQSTVQEVLNRGFEIGNHTTDHSNLNKLDASKAKEKIYGNNDTFKEITGQDFPLLRPPYGNCKQSVKELINVPIIMWSVDSRDWESRNAEKIVSLVKSNAKSGDIVLFHDLYASTLEAIKVLVPYYYDKGYKIVGVTELFEINGMELKSGEKYYHAY